MFLLGLHGFSGFFLPASQNMPVDGLATLNYPRCERVFSWCPKIGHDGRGGDTPWLQGQSVFLLVDRLWILHNPDWKHIFHRQPVVHWC